MPWVRIDENAMQHPKVGGLSDGAFRLWVEALAYCQKYLTDGAVNALALRGLHAYSPKRRTMLVAAGLWAEAVEGGIQVHDYLQWNESRQHVTAAREQARDRRDRYRRRHASGDASPSPSATPNVPSGVGCRELRVISDEGEGGAGETSLTARAGAFCEWYADKHAALFGIGYMGTNQDYMKAIELCKRFSDQDLRDAAIVWFGHADDFATKGTRTVPKFASRISGCLATVRKVTA